MIEKVIRSAVANANEQEAADRATRCIVAKAWVDPGPVDQAVSAEGSRQGVFDHEADEPPGA